MDPFQYAKKLGAHPIWTAIVYKLIVSLKPRKTSKKKNDKISQNPLSWRTNPLLSCWCSHQPFSWTYCAGVMTGHELAFLFLSRSALMAWRRILCQRSCCMGQNISTAPSTVANGVSHDRTITKRKCVPIRIEISNGNFNVHVVRQ